jgi:hypothetical protein
VPGLSSTRRCYRIYVTSLIDTTVSIASISIYHHFCPFAIITMSGPGEISQESLIFSISPSATDPKTAVGSLQWHVDYESSGSDDSSSPSDNATVTGIQLYRRRQHLEIEDTTTEISAFERKWRELTFLAEEFAWLNNSSSNPPFLHYVLFPSARIVRHGLTDSSSPRPIPETQNPPSHIFRYPSISLRSAIRKPRTRHR